MCANNVVRSVLVGSVLLCEYTVCSGLLSFVHGRVACCTTLAVIPDNERDKHPDLLRRIPCLAIRPTEDLGQMAADQYEKFPAMLRHLLRGIGAKGESGWDLLSYLAFQPGYVGRLIELGYQDTMGQRDEIQAFFETPFEDFAPPSMIPPPVSARKA